MKAIKILSGTATVAAALNDSDTAQKILEALPLEGEINTWGAEVYFTIPVVVNQAPDARSNVAAGELGYWPMGKAFCIFFGPTPASNDEAPRAASPVNVFGRVTDGLDALKGFRDGDPVTVAAADND